jgi:2-polyprenyl-6-methoxyphenol hydroxylase-like FAD-dependent oxidoreductase
VKVEQRVLDVAIVGGGVAGASLAAVLAQAELGVAVIEREPRFRDRVRGESMHPWGMREADWLGLLPVLLKAGGNNLPVWQRYAGRAPLEPYRWADDTPGGYGELGIFHPAMQQALLDHAGACGADVLRPARVTSFRDGDPSEIEVATERGPAALRARLVVGADGRTSAARRWIGAATHSDPPHHVVSGCLLDGVDLDETAAHVAAPQGTHALVFPQGGGRVRGYLMWGTERAAVARSNGGERWFRVEIARYYPEGAFDGTVSIGPAASFPNNDIWPDRIAGESVVLIGDAAGANDPSLGHGLSLTMRDVRELRDLLLDDRDWRRAIQTFAERRATYYAVLREATRWHAILLIEEGPEAEARRKRAERARATDPTIGGFGLLITHGPDGIVADDAARRAFFGEE